MRDGIEIGIAKEEIRELIQNLIFQFGWRECGRWKGWNGSRWYRSWRGTFRGWWTHCLSDNSAHFCSHDNRRSDTAAAFGNDRRTRGEKHRENREGNHFFHIGLLWLRTL